MLNKEKINSRDILFEEALSSVKVDIRFTLIILTFFVLLALFGKFILGIAVPLFVFIILFVWALLYFSYNYLIKRKKNKEELCNFYFRNNIIDLLLLTAIIHYLGGVEWIGAIFYLLVLAWTGNVLPKKKALTLCLLAIFFYSVLVSLEYFQFLPHRVIFGPSLGFYQDPAYILIQILTVAAILFFIAETYGTFSGALKKKQEELSKTQGEVEEARKVLEIKVKARTRELQELAEKQEERVKERTKELQEKIEELERFSRLTVGRELKMVELKREIKKLEEELKGRESK